MKLSNKNEEATLFIYPEIGPAYVEMECHRLRSPDHPSSLLRKIQRRLRKVYHSRECLRYLFTLLQCGNLVGSTADRMPIHPTKILPRIHLPDLRVCIRPDYEPSRECAFGVHQGIVQPDDWPNARRSCEEEKKMRSSSCLLHHPVRHGVATVTLHAFHHSKPPKPLTLERIPSVKMSALLYSKRKRNVCSSTRGRQTVVIY